MTVKSVSLILTTALLLAACTEEAAPDAAPVETGGEAAGDVLGGTISDDMLPLEELTSTSPRAERTASASSGDSTSSQAAPVEDGAEAEAPAIEVEAAPNLAPVPPVVAPSPETSEPPTGE